MNIAYFIRPKGRIAFLYDDCSFRQALEKMRIYHYNTIPVISRSGQYMGTVNEGDFLWDFMGADGINMRELELRSIRELLNRKSHPPVRITATLEELIESSIKHNFTPVVDDLGSFIGIITRREIIRYLAENSQTLQEDAVPQEPAEVR